jgi:hypothetical protein
MGHRVSEFPFYLLSMLKAALRGVTHADMTRFHKQGTNPSRGVSYTASIFER